MLCLALAIWKEPRAQVQSRGSFYHISLNVPSFDCTTLSIANGLSYLPYFGNTISTDSNHMARQARLNTLPPLNWYCSQWGKCLTTTIWAGRSQTGHCPQVILRLDKRGPGPSASPWEVSELSHGVLSLVETREPEEGIVFKPVYTMS